jgi:hypothetical protein
MIDRIQRVTRTLLLVLLALPSVARAQHLLVPMDDAQANHLKAYGLVFASLKMGSKAEWFLNYRGGSFLLLDELAVRRKALLDGVSFEPIGDGPPATWMPFPWRKHRASRFIRRRNRHPGTTL